MAGCGVALTAAVIGLGVGEQHIKAYQAAGIRVPIVCDTDAARAAIVGHEYGIDLVVSDWRKNFLKPDIISIASYDQYHAEQVCAALKADKHVFCEKPLCTSPEELRRILIYWHSRSCHLVMSTPLRFHPPFIELKEGLAKIGEPYHVQLEYNYGRLSKLREGWRAKEGHYSMVLGGGTHMIDLMLWLLGKRVRVVKPVGGRLRAPELGNFDTIACALELEGGITGTLTVNGGYDGQHEHVVIVWGSEGKVEVRNREPVDKGKPIQAFIERLRQNGEQRRIVGLEAMRTCFKIEKALHE